jgi:hypothetical protein
MDLPIHKIASIGEAELVVQCEKVGFDLSALHQVDSRQQYAVDIVRGNCLRRLFNSLYKLYCPPKVRVPIMKALSCTMDCACCVLRNSGGDV